MYLTVKIALEKGLPTQSHGFLFFLDLLRAA